jgi:exodeoxyribonuclease VII large subunit
MLEPIYSVTQLNREAREILEGSFPPLWVEGEISNFLAHNSGHWYFSLKDAQAQIRCAFFRARNSRINFQPKNGMHIKLHGQLSLYEGRGDFQLIVDDMEEAGEGRLRKAFEDLKKRLAQEGLFDPVHKKTLPKFPTCIGVVTSPTGAAIRDILNILNRRFRCAPVIIYPTLVQGDTAAPAIAQAIQIANRRRECDVLIVARGGGSLEDLWPFNEEIVARAIYQSEIPIVSGIGHEIDFTIADFVADQRAPTPSGAAELVAPDCSELTQAIQQDKRHLVHQMQAKLCLIQQHLTWTSKHLQQQHPQRKLAEKMQFLDLCEANLVRLQTQFLQNHQARLKTLSAKLMGLTPSHRIRHQLQQLHRQQDAFQNKIIHALHQRQLQLSNTAVKLDALSPLNTLARGYAIASKSQDGKIIKSVKEVGKGEKLNVRFVDGNVSCTTD